MEEKIINTNELVLTEKLIAINRVAKVLKGGKRISFQALTVTGDGQGHVGVGMGKAKEVPIAISKAGADARKNVVEVELKGTTIPYEVRAKYGASRVLLKPAVPGTGIIACSTVSAVVEAAGVKDILSKVFGSTNPINLTKATLLALSVLRDPEEEIAKRKGVGAAEEMATNGKS